VQPDYLHQVVVPYIPHQEGYFKDSLKILIMCPFVSGQRYRLKHALVLLIMGVVM
jgi:hypothetical protein